MKRCFLLLLFVMAALVASCNPGAGDEVADKDKATAPSDNITASPTTKTTGRVLGTAKSPLIQAFVPSVEAQKVVESARPLAELLRKRTGYFVKNMTATSYIAVVEALGQGHAHIAWLPPMAYVLARQRNGARVILKVVRHGQAVYHGIILVRKDSGINTLSDLKGRTFAFVEPASASGHLYPRALLMKNGIDPDRDLKRCIFSGSHDSAVLAVFNGSVDAAACYDDARTKLAKTMPELLSETKVLARTADIPSDNVVVSKDAKDSDYDTLREMAQVLGLDIEKQVRGED
ncbi:MAG: hypothetical protein B1H03_06845 [Planctomycetales bacterium 4484_113]|nr:MAG: hypothetical protein B1H03_06845 [Planctomycetales bacterium 4484_113]